MINSKRITLLSLVLITAVLLAMLYFIIFPQETTDSLSGTVSYGESHSVVFLEADYYSDFSDAVEINGKDGNNVRYEESGVQILGGGTYRISGKCGSITVDAEDGGLVRLILDDAEISNGTISVIQSGKTVISVPEGTESTVGGITSKDDLVINGKGTLNVTGSSDDAIKANDTLKIIGADVRITAADDGINANDYLAVRDSKIEITADGDGIKCEHEDADKGFIALENTEIKAETGGDGVVASSALYAENVTMAVKAGGGGNVQTLVQDGKMSFAGIDTQTSKKAIKAGTSLQINGGAYTLDSYDDALHSDGDISINGGSFTVSTGNDALHAEKEVELYPDKFDVISCLEGIEGARITVNGGEISIASSDDAINAVGEIAAAGRPGMMYGGEAKTAEEDIFLTVNGGNIRIETSGDGIDSNGSAIINGGSVTVFGPENSGNGSVDMGDGGYVLIMNGGTLFAAGSSGMAEAPYEGSNQNTIEFYLDNSYSRESKISVVNGNGDEIASEAPTKHYNYICLSSPDIKIGEAYKLYIDGEEIAEVTSNDVVTIYGERGRGMRW